MPLRRGAGAGEGRPVAGPDWRGLQTMVALSLANILHHKLRSALSALGVGIGVALLITLTGLSRGSLQEVAQRWDAVDADLFVSPAHWSDNVTTLSGGGLGPADTAAVGDLTVAGKKAIEHVVPVYLFRARVAGWDHNLIGVDPQDLPRLLSAGGVRSGRIFDPENKFADWLSRRLSSGGEERVDVNEQELARHGGLEMIIDSRLARAGRLSVGSTVYTAGHHFIVVGIVPEGALARVMIPRATAEYLFNGRLGRYTLLFAKVRAGVPLGTVLEALRKGNRLSAVSVKEYRAMLESTVGVMYVYIDAVNAVTLIVSFLFVLVTLYTTVIQHQREIAILKSMGASSGRILRGVLGESMILTLAGVAAGIALSFAAAWLIEQVAPLLTVTISWRWVALAVLLALGGGTIAALYPGWCAARTDVVEALSLE